MLTVESLNEFGANTQEGLARCMNNADFYLKMVRMSADDQNFSALQEALAQNDLDRAFELAHALKGVMGNLSLTPLYDPISEMTELLRNRTEMDYSSYAQEIAQKYEQLRQILAEG
jgi:HPt (histidine-containing phosphotransfer) domain-containing protein